jgi:hypothetical protein
MKRDYTALILWLCYFVIAYQYVIKYAGSLLA